MPLELEFQSSSTIPIEIEGILPETMREISLDEMRRQEVFFGNRKVPLGEFFKLRGTLADQDWHFVGDLSKVHWIGSKLKSGSISIHGNGGRHVGSDMTGGQIRVEGNVGDWLGAEMQGGLIEIRGSAGHLVGGAYSGSPTGMSGGEILVHGDAGNEVGHSMRRGLIAIGGGLGEMFGFNMRAGTIIAFGKCGARFGAGMRRGTIAVLGHQNYELLPTFRFAYEDSPVALSLLIRRLRKLGFPVPAGISDRCHVAAYSGDSLEGGRGELLLALPR